MSHCNGTHHQGLNALQGHATLKFSPQNPYPSLKGQIRLQSSATRDIYFCEREGLHPKMVVFFFSPGFVAALIYYLAPAMKPQNNIGIRMEIHL
jgi:hypothetical protein